MKAPQPFPYQGSKRNLASAILCYFPEGVGALIEPFAGSAAITLAAAANDLAESFVINDFNKPLIQLWKAIIDSPQYMDPPYQGVCGERDPRYLKSVVFTEFVEVLETLNTRDASYLVSYDGRTGDKVHGRRLPNHLRLHLVELEAGRSSQATLLGRDEITVESLYLSPALADRLQIRRRYQRQAPGRLHSHRHASDSPCRHCLG